MSRSALRQWVAAVLGSGPVAAPRLRSRLSFDVLEDRLTPSTLLVDQAAGPYHTIQSAVNAANPGDTIVVDPGTYTEQVTIGPGKDHLTLTTAAGKPDAAIQAPAFAAPASPADIDAAYVVRITGSKNVSLNDFNINGGAGNNAQFGIKLDFGASAYLTNNNVTNIVAPQFNGLGGGAGIDVGEANEGTTQAIVCSNSVSGYGKVGIVVDGGGSLAAVAYNSVTGLGAAGVITQYGIQVSDGANGDVCGNCVSGNTDGIQQSAGILIFGAGSHTEIEDNSTHGNEYGIFVYLTNNIEVENNLSYANNNDGIQLQGTNNSSVTQNVSAYNGGDGISVYGSQTGNPASAQNNTVANNVIYGNAGNGVTVQDTTGTKVVDNLIVDNGGSGVSLTDASGGQVKFNFIDQDNPNQGISVTSSSAKINNNCVVS